MTNFYSYVEIGQGPPLPNCDLYSPETQGPLIRPKYPPEYLPETRKYFVSNSIVLKISRVSLFTPRSFFLSCQAYPLT